MKARVKANNAIVEVKYHSIDPLLNQGYYRTDMGEMFVESELDFQNLTLVSGYTGDYWERLKHQYAGMAMQGLISCREILLQLGNAKDMSTEEATASAAYNIATALVERMKNQ